MKLFTSPVSTGVKRRGEVKSLFREIKGTDQSKSTNNFILPHHTGGVSFIWKFFTSPRRDPTASEVGFHYTGSVAFVM